MIRVLLVGDPYLPGRPLRALLAHDAGLIVVGELAFDRQLPALAARLHPDVVVVDPQLMVSQILPTLDELRAAVPQCAVLVLADPGRRGMLPPRRRHRGLSFLVQDAPGPLLAQTIRRVAAGESVIHPRLEAASLGTHKQISTRELEVLGLAAEGEPVAEIAGRLYLSLGTVRNYLSAVIAKTGARNRIDAIRIVRKDGWLT